MTDEIQDRLSPQWTQEKYQATLLEALQRARPKGMSQGALRCYCDNLHKIEQLLAVNDLLVEGKIDAQWNEENQEFEISLLDP